MKIPFTLHDGSYFEIAGGSITGTAHIRSFRNNQDAFTWGWITTPWPAFVAVVADGCGEGKHSEVGARLAAESIKRSLLEYLKVYPFAGKPAGIDFWKQIQERNLDVLWTKLSAMGDVEQEKWDNTIDVIKKFGLFTINGILITDYLAIFFSIGDGVYAINDEVIKFGEEYNNKPPYFAYNLIKKQVAFSDKDLSFSLNKLIVINTMGGQAPDKFNSFMIGSDGVNDLAKVKDVFIPGTNEPVGKINQFWSADQYFDQKYALQTKLKLINREVKEPILDKMKGETYARIQKSPGLLPDDTTMIVGRRVSSDVKLSSQQKGGL